MPPSSTSPFHENPENASKNVKTRYQILLVEDHPLIRQGMKALLSRNRGFEICGETDTAGNALELLSKLKPDLAIIDITLKDADGLELTRKVRSVAPATQVLVVSMHDESVYAERAIKAGAMGYLMKDEAAENIINAIDCILLGRVFMSERIRKRMPAGSRGE